MHAEGGNLETIVKSRIRSLKSSFKFTAIVISSRKIYSSKNLLRIARTVIDYFDRYSTYTMFGRFLRVVVKIARPRDL